MTLLAAPLTVATEAPVATPTVIARSGPAALVPPGRATSSRAARRVVVLGAAITGVALTFWWIRANARPPAGSAGGAIRLVTPQLRTLDSTITATGVIRPRVGGEVRIGSQVSGVVRELRVTEGSHVRRGEILAVLDTTPLTARLAQARAQVEVDRIELARTRANLARGERLAALELISTQQADELRYAAAAAAAKVERSRSDVGVVETDIANAQLRAPISGTIASVSTQEGETVAASFAAPTFVTILADDALQLVAVVDETDIGHVLPGNAARFTTEAFPTREIEGRVLSIAPKATIISGVVNYEVTIAILGPAAELKPDMTANVSIRTARHQALLIPASAVRREGEETAVGVRVGGRTSLRTVTLGARDGAWIEVKAGLAPGDAVTDAPPPGGHQGD